MLVLITSNVLELQGWRVSPRQARCAARSKFLARQILYYLHFCKYFPKFPQGNTASLRQGFLSLIATKFSFSRFFWHFNF
jgi:hypothetical protein